MNDLDRRSKTTKDRFRYWWRFSLKRGAHRILTA